MSQQGEPTDNPVAERVNGILKDEVGFDLVFSDSVYGPQRNRILA